MKTAAFGILPLMGISLSRKEFASWEAYFSCFKFKPLLRRDAKMMAELLPLKVPVHVRH